jgi:GT2 family glycosyltransferase
LFKKEIRQSANPPIRKFFRMDSAKQLVIDIVTWNSERFLPRLFESIDAQTSKAFTVTVIDNGSTDGTLAWLEVNRPDVTILRNRKNLGFSRAHNQGIALARSRWAEIGELEKKYIFILNPDILLHERCIEELIASMDTHPDVEVSGPKLLRAFRISDREDGSADYEQTNTSDSKGISMLKSRKFGDRGAGEEDHGQYDAVEPFGISGAALVLRASAVPLLAEHDAVVFDEEIFAYKEDADLAWRLRLFGGKAALAASAIAWHQRRAKASRKKGPLGVAFGQFSRSSFVNTLSRRNKMWMEWKNDDWSSRLLHLPWRIFDLFLRAASLVFPAQLNGAIQAWAGLPMILNKRKVIMARRKLSPEAMRKWFA